MTNVQKLAEAPCPQCSGAGSFYHGTVHSVCESCHGIGAMVPDLRLPCQKSMVKYRSETTPHHRNCNCKGPGWTLIPEREQMGVLARTAYKLGFRVSGHGSLATHKYYTILRVESNHLWFGEGVTPEEALARALCQAVGIE